MRAGCFGPRRNAATAGCAAAMRMYGNRMTSARWLPPAGLYAGVTGDGVPIVCAIVGRGRPPRAGASGMPRQVVDGAILKCSFGTTPSVMGVLPKNVSWNTTPAATILDHVPMTNIRPFGMCMSIANPQVVH